MAARFTYSTKCDPQSEALFPAYIHVSSIGNIHFPLGIQNAQRLMCIADPIPCGYGSNTMINSNYHHGWYVNGRDIFTATESCFLETIEAWVNNALSLIGIEGKAIGARALLSRLLIYPVGGYCKQQVQLSEEPGHFATLRVQIPIQGGYSGGSLEIKDNHECLELDHSLDSDSSFYLTIVHVQSEFGLAEVTSGCRVELIFNLLWTPPLASLYPEAHDVTPFLVTLSKLHNDLTRWCSLNDQEGPVKMIMIRLDNAYQPETHSFSSLAATDHLVAYLFRSLDMVEVHLAYLTRKTKKSTSNLNSMTVISNNGVPSLVANVDLGLAQVISTQHIASHWIDANDRPIRFDGFNIDAQVQDVEALIDSNATPKSVHLLANDGSNATIELEHNRNVLVLWPKCKRFQVMLNHRFDYLLHLMEIEDDKESCLETLRSVLDYENEWLKNENTICKLLNISRRLQVREEALQLLNMLASYSVGVCSKDVAILIAQIDSEVLGWSVCLPAIEKLLNIDAVPNLKHFITLADHFFIRGSFFAFQYAAERTWKVFLQSDDNLICREVKTACMKLMIRLEEFSQSDLVTKEEQLMDSFLRWDPVNQCNLIMDLEDLWTRSPAKSYKLFKNLSLIFIQTLANLSTFPSDLLIDFFSLLLNLYDEGLDVVDVFAKSLNYLTKRFSDGFLANLLSTFESINPPREFLVLILDARIQELKSTISSGEEKTKWEQKDAKFPVADQFPDVVSFLHSNERYMVSQAHFGSIKQARDFAVNYFEPIDECLKLGYSAIATAAGSGKKSKVRLVKTLHVHYSKQQALKKELERLVSERSNLDVSRVESTSHV